MTQAELPSEGSGKKRIPKLPGSRPWQPLTKEWWREVWQSPMAAQFLSSDKQGLYRLAALIDEFWNKPTRELAAEIRMEQAAYGLTPIDRLRLQWETKPPEGEKPQTPARRSRKDPRELLRRVK